MVIQLQVTPLRREDSERILLNPIIRRRPPAIIRALASPRLTVGLATVLGGLVLAPVATVGALAVGARAIPKVVKFVGPRKLAFGAGVLATSPTLLASLSPKRTGLALITLGGSEVGRFAEKGAGILEKEGAGSILPKLGFVAGTALAVGAGILGLRAVSRLGRRERAPRVARAPAGLAPTTVQALAPAPILALGKPALGAQKPPVVAVEPGMVAKKERAINIKVSQKVNVKQKIFKPGVSSETRIISK